MSVALTRVRLRPRCSGPISAVARRAREFVEEP